MEGRKKNRLEIIGWRAGLAEEVLDSGSKDAAHVDLKLTLGVNDEK